MNFEIFTKETEQENLLELHSEINKENCTGKILSFKPAENSNDIETFSQYEQNPDFPGTSTSTQKKYVII